MEPYSLRSAQKILPVSDDLTVLLLKREGPLQGIDRNLVCCDRSGRVIWECTPPGRPDSFTEVELFDGVLSAYSFSGHICHIELKTGHIQEIIFTK